mmetsp:Transcript_22759/g.63286  ORF Transcript_22759/g.63286 Transcript_22759/m.63286 type:complete len:209 (-) Transcript_22759:167-793(-)
MVKCARRPRILHGMETQPRGPVRLKSLRNLWAHLRRVRSHRRLAHLGCAKVKCPRWLRMGTKPGRLFRPRMACLRRARASRQRRLAQRLQTPRLRRRPRQGRPWSPRMACLRRARASPQRRLAQRPLTPRPRRRPRQGRASRPRWRPCSPRMRPRGMWRTRRCTSTPTTDTPLPCSQWGPTRQRSASRPRSLRPAHRRTPCVSRGTAT